VSDETTEADRFTTLALSTMSKPVCPLGHCDGSGLLAPHPATSSADAGLDDPCPCRDGDEPASDEVCSACHLIPEPGAPFPEHTCADEVSPLDAAWAKADAAQREALDLPTDARWLAANRAHETARAHGPRRTKVST